MSRRVKSQSGQAAIEYILLLVITVALIIALVSSFFKPLQKFVSAYMGDYVECVLRTGELPSFGNEEAAGVLSGQGCNAKFEPASFAAGRPQKADSSGSSQSKDKNSSSGDSGPIGGSGAAAAGRSNLSGGSSRFTKASDGSGDGKKSVEIALNDGGGGAFFKSSVVGYSNGRTNKSQNIDISRLSVEERKKLLKEEKLVSRSVASGYGGTSHKKFTIKPPSKADKDMSSDDTPMSFGDYLRMLFIIGIILAILIFVGGQVLQMSKSYNE